MKAGSWLAVIVLMELGAALLYWQFINGRFLFAIDGKPLLADFTTFWSAGQFAIDGHAAIAYDGPSIYQRQREITGQDLWLPFVYPPQFLFIAAALAMLPYGVAFVGFEAVTAGLYAVVTATIARRPIAGVL